MTIHVEPAHKRWRIEVQLIEETVEGLASVFPTHVVSGAIFRLEVLTFDDLAKAVTAVDAGMTRKELRRRLSEEAEAVLSLLVGKERA